MNNESSVISNGSDIISNRSYVTSNGLGVTSVDLSQLLSEGLGIAVVRRPYTEACRRLRRLVVDHHHLQSIDYNVSE
jgi:hypothetical protein